ncbi:MAG: glycine cleavage T C-terminal barrel domain-containing protein [Acidimicrobiales bacterium]
MRSDLRLARHAEIDESPYFAAASRHADPDRAVVGVRGRQYHFLHYGDPIAEYWALIDGAVLWDGSFQRQVEIVGRDATAFVQYLVPRDLSGHEVGQAKYAFMTDVHGGIVADPVILRLDDDRYWLSASEVDLHLWCEGLSHRAGFAVVVRTPDTAPVQVQGPQATAVVSDLLGEDLGELGYYRLTRRSHAGVELVVSRTGWGGAEGFEIHVVSARADGGRRAATVWESLLRAGERHGIVPAGPSQIRRIEAGMPAYGRDIDADCTPFETGPGFEWMVDLAQPDDFVGKEALRERREAGPRRVVVGLEIDGDAWPGMTDGTAPWTPPLAAGDRTVGRLTSVCMSPRLRRIIGLATVTASHAGAGRELLVSDPGGGARPATVVDPRHDRRIRR